MKSKSIAIYLAALASLPWNCTFAATWSEIPMDAVVISVNGRKTTKREFDAYVKMMEVLFANKNPGVAKNKEKFIGVQFRIRMSAKGEILSRSIQYTNLCTNDIQPTASQIENIKDRCRTTFCRKGQSFEDLCDYLREAEVDETFMRYFNEDTKIHSALQQLYSDRLTVTNDDENNATRHVTEYNARASATNALICAVATNVLKKLRAGGNFAKLADEFSMDAHKNPGGDLGECSIETFLEEGSSYFAAVAALKVGDFSDILEGSTGYSIMKRTGEHTYSQIFFRKPYLFEVLTGEALVEDLKKEKRATLLEELAPVFAKSAKVEYPCGDVFVKPTSTPKQQRRKKK